MIDRIPCIYRGKPLNPISWRRALKLEFLGKGVLSRDKVLGLFFKLLSEPSKTRFSPKVSLGVDPGIMFMGMTVLTPKFSFNIMYEHTIILQDKNWIKSKSESRRYYRRMRRSRLWHREARFSNRSKRKISNTANYYYQNIINLVIRLKKFYNISDIVIEDTKFNHRDFRNGKSFSNLEIGKTRLYSKLRELSDNLIISNYNPKLLRNFGINKNGDYFDYKVRNKTEKSFWSHCIDSHSLACISFNCHLPYTENLLYISRKNPYIDQFRRVLQRVSSPRRTKQQIKLGIQLSNRKSKLRKLRIKLDQSYRSNHGPWKYIYTKLSITYKKVRYKFGSSYYLSSHHGHSAGSNKYLSPQGYIYYNTEFIRKLTNYERLNYYINDYSESEMNTSG